MKEGDAEERRSDVVKARKEEGGVRCSTRLSDTRCHVRYPCGGMLGGRNTLGQCLLDREVLKWELESFALVICRVNEGIK